MAENTVIITKIGLSKIAGASVEQPLVLENFVLGDGNNTLTPDATSLLSEKYRDFINDIFHLWRHNFELIKHCSRGIMYSHLLTHLFKKESMVSFKGL